MFQINNSGLRAALMLGAATASALSLTAPANAVETVVVTGSRIPQVGIYATSPVTAVGSHEIMLEGSTTVGAALANLPSVVNDGDGPSVNNGSVGVSTIDLRNLGAKRTLVLVDGKRLVASDASLNVDTNQIPATMIDRIEVLTGGASAVYGSDAVAGVVNLILKKDFEGLEADAQGSSTDRDDGRQVDASLLLGVNSDNGKGNVTIYGEYMHRDPVSEANRDFSAHALAATNYTGCTPGPATHFGGFCFSGSGTIAEGRVKNASLGGPTIGAGIMFGLGGTVANYDGRTFNFAPFQQLQTQGERYSFGANAHYQVNSSVDFYTRLTFSDNQATTQIGPSPMTALIPTNCGNPNMTAAVRQAIFGTTPVGTITAQCLTIAASPDITPNVDPNFTTRLLNVALRLTKVGPRIGQNDHAAFQLVGGVRGDIGSGWSYDVSAQYGHTTASQFLLNDALLENFKKGLIVDPTTGLCITDPATCSPLNFFTNGGLTTANVDYIRSNLVVDTEVSQWDMIAVATGTLDALSPELHSPWAKDPIGTSVGLEFRQESAAVNPDHNLEIGNLVGNNRIVHTAGGFNVYEGFFEARVPIVQDVQFIKDLTFEGSARYSNYDKVGSTFTWKAGLEWQVTDDFKFRVAQERSVRAPNVSELFSPPGGSSANAGKDPCSAVGSVPTTAALCIATGVPIGSVFSAALNCPTNQCQGALGGNPALKPEVADSRTLGIVFTPTFIPGLTATIDWYDIKIAKYISAIPMQTILAGCYSTVLNPLQAFNSFCALIHRDALGTIATSNTGFVIQQEANIAENKTDGLDVELTYTTEGSDWGLDGWGSLSTNFVGTLSSFNELSVVGFSCVGVWGTQCGEPEPRFKSNMRVTWTDEESDFSLSLRWRHLSGVQFELNQFGFLNSRDNTANFPTPGCCFNDNDFPLRIAAYDYFDLSGTWNVMDSVLLRGGVRNIMDKTPPVTDNNSAPASSVNGNTFPGTYDALGRVIFLGATVKM